MHSAELTPSVLAELRRPRRYPAVSVVMPTHRSEPDNAQDPVRLRNLVAEAKSRLQADEAVSRADRLDLVHQLDRAVAEVDLVHAEDALLIFAAPGEHQVWSLPRSVPERVVFSETFLTRNLVATHAAAAPYWVLTVSAERAALFGGAGPRLAEAAERGFPVELRPDLPDVERKERIGDVPSTFRDEQTRHYLREADTALAAVLEAEPRPLYVLGEAAALAVLEEIGTATKTAVAQVPRGGLGRASVAVVREAVAGAVKEQAARVVVQAKERLDQALGVKALAAGIDEVWQSVAEGRAALVVLEEDYWEPVRVTDNHLVPASAGEPDVRDDMVDEIVERALDTGAQVEFVPTGELAGQGRIAAVLRY
ncbi:chemotaxis protein [Kitasatospora sp. NBC_00240]|uniref:baeRF3 domain-containing protein n=1 Tax=Kitasatospora sp. NBC_00240 TaxID=2903567 RepID=UPI0022539613|nr:chemotaxis protein [Kitasatospora sp. NBC_00240]MCX5207982.1 chemotaxis protein [Kitasatospora sp. NBC_00240]